MGSFGGPEIPEAWYDDKVFGDIILVGLPGWMLFQLGKSRLGNHTCGYGI
jgi:hypothetical protein